MALFTNKQEFEVLQADNDKLKDKITLLEVRLSAKDKAIAEMRVEIDKLDSQAEEYRTAIEKHKSAAANSISFHEVEKIRQGYCIEINGLKTEISRLQTRPHNERGAGRKRKATPEQVEYILTLSADGLSHVKIAKILAEQSGDNWNKSTVRNIIMSAKS